MNKQNSVLESVFNNYLKGSTIFKNREALRHDFIPEYLPHREEQIRYLGEILAPSLKGSICSNALIYGKTGTGKTAATKFVLEKLFKKAEELDSNLNICFINCRIAGTEYRIFSKICSNINVDIPFTGLSLGEVFERFKKGLESRKVLLIIVLDEIDSIIKDRGDVILYELTRINGSLKKSKVSILGISNDLKFKELLDPRALSTLSEEEIIFKPYNANELEDILEERAKIAFRFDVISEGTIKLCSALAAAEHGDARRALDLLRVSGELAERKGEKYVFQFYVRKAQNRIEHDRISETLKSLPIHSKIVLLSVYLISKKAVTSSITGDIYNLYIELCSELGYNSLTQRRVSGLINELDVIGLLNSKVISLGRYGRTRKTSLGISHSEVNECFLFDERLKNMVDYNPIYLDSSRFKKKILKNL